MLVYEIPNIEHCNVRQVANSYLITANDGWCIHCPEHEENSYTTIVFLVATYDFSTVQILPVSSLPEGAEINADTGEEVGE